MSTISPASRVAGIQLALSTSGPRETPEPAGRRFRSALNGAAQLVLSGVERASGALTGTSMMTAALSRGGGITPTGADAGGDASTSTAAGGLGENILSTAMHENMAFIHLQHQMGQESQRFSTLSNVMKARHETAKATINNIR